MPKGVYERRTKRATFDEFLSRADRSGECWVWTGSRLKSGGYGLFCEGGITHRAHRRSWELSHGEIPGGLFVLHRCDNPPCVRPSHLFLGTQADNNKDMTSKGRHRATFQAEYERRRRLTSCKKGHPYEGNTYTRKDGSRFCKTCHKERVARYLAKR